MLNSRGSRLGNFPRAAHGRGKGLRRTGVSLALAAMGISRKKKLRVRDRRLILMRLTREGRVVSSQMDGWWMDDEWMMELSVEQRIVVEGASDMSRWVAYR